jgi:hypothetical protein
MPGESAYLPRWFVTVRAGVGDADLCRLAAYESNGYLPGMVSGARLDVELAKRVVVSQPVLSICGRADCYRSAA